MRFLKSIKKPQTKTSRLIINPLAMSQKATAVGTDLGFSGANNAFLFRQITRKLGRVLISINFELKDNVLITRRYWILVHP